MLANRLPLIITAMAFSLISLTTSLVLASPVTTLMTQRESIPDFIILEAKLEAIKQSTISAQTQGIVEVVNFDINDEVKAGQTLILINNSQQQATLSQAQAALAQAQALNKDAQIIRQRQSSLLAQKNLSQGEFDSALARANSASAAVLAAEARVKLAQEQLSYTRISAPYSGIVRQRLVQIGELVKPGQALMMGFATKPLRAVVDIPQSIAAELLKQKSEQRMIWQQAINIIANGQYYKGDQMTFFPYADSRYSSIRARINIADSPYENGLMPGAWVQVQLPLGQQQGIFLPPSAILQQGEVASIYVKKNNQFSLRYVRLGQIQQDKRVRILSGLEIAEQVAIDALAAAKEVARSRAHRKAQ